MRNFQIIISSLFLVFAFPAFAQDTINHLEEVVLSDSRLFNNSRGQAVSVLKDSVLVENEPLLGSLLKYNSPVFFRENGYGMVSSASFRGTTASQTAVVWNGININSQFTGQTDFNTINTSGYDNIAVRAGGGSVLYGSGAIGGSVHLNNSFKFNNKIENRLRLEYGSFDTKTGSYSAEASSERTSAYLNLSGISSDNDYKYLGTDLFNQNGDFYNWGVGAGAAHWLNSQNILKFYLDYFSGERGFSGTLTAPSKSKYEDLTGRNLLEWKGFFNDFTSTMKLAYLHEQYKYFENREREEHTLGKANNYIFNYDANFEINPTMEISGIIDFRRTEGEGTNVGKNSRDITAFALLFNHDVGNWFYEFSGRKEITQSYVSPLLYSFSTGYSITSYYEATFNFSKNFRIPTYNDLFWRAGGNTELQPETSYQAELGQTLHFPNLEIGFTGFVMEIDNLLRWIPNATGLWQPVNTESVRNYGAEGRVNYNKSYGEHNLLFTANYTYTQTMDKKLDKKLIYVPEHKITGTLSYSFHKLSAFYQFLYNGKIFTSSDNNYTLPGYSVSNLGLGYYPLKNKALKIGLQVRNLYNNNYQSLPSRPMPGRSINSSLTYNF